MPPCAPQCAPPLQKSAFSRVLVMVFGATEDSTIYSASQKSELGWFWRFGSGQVGAIMITVQLEAQSAVGSKVAPCIRDERTRDGEEHQEEEDAGDAAHGGIVPST
jgi:hypothetical protein